MRRILILSGIQLSTNPRVVKEAHTLAAAGYDVEVVGATLEPDLRERDRQLCAGEQWAYTTLVEADSSFARGRWKWLKARTRRRIARDAQAWLRIESANQLGYVAPEMLQYTLDNPADLVIVHNPQALWAGAELIRRGRKVVVDMEDWYSEDVLIDHRRNYPLKSLREWERLALRGSAFSITTSSCLSQALARTYGCELPAVIYNSFPLGERDSIDGELRDRRDLSLPSVCWFSQVVGPSRGLETLMAALAHMDVPMEIHLRGKSTPAYRDLLLAKAPESWRGRIHFHSPVPHADLISRIAEHDLGLAMEVPCNRNKELTIANKIPFYLLAGLPVLASDTEGQKEAAGIAEGPITTYAAECPRSLAIALDALLSNREGLRAARDEAVLAAERVFCWERSEQVLLEHVARAL